MGIVTGKRILESGVKCMYRTWKRIVAFMLVLFIFFSGYAFPEKRGLVQAQMMYTESQEFTSEEKSTQVGQDTETEKESKEQMDIEQSDIEQSDIEQIDKEQTDIDKVNREESDDIGKNTGDEIVSQKEESREGLTGEEGKESGFNKNISLFSTLGPHDVDMPDLTSHYFKLQKQSKKVSGASGKYLKVVSDTKEASKYIFSEMTHGNEYSFTPRKTASTTVTVGGGDGGAVSLAKVKNGSRSEYGEVYVAVNNGRVKTRVYNLSKCTTDPYALYTNVGSWYDSSSRKTYSVDMKLTVTGFLYPSKKIRNQLNSEYKAPYIGFRNNMIGLYTMATDTIRIKMDFYYHGTQNKISNLRGVIQFGDIDVQQGIDLGSGFEKVVMFNMDGSHLQYHDSGILNGSKGYVSSRTVENINTVDAKTTVLGVFSGSSVECQWSIAKCDQKDTGGSAAYAVASGYGIPADSSLGDAVSYYYSNSTGFIGVYSELGLMPFPTNIEKNEYVGSVDASKSTINQKELRVDNREEEVTFVLTSAAAYPSNLKTAQYESYVLKDQLEAAYSVKKGDIRIFTEQSVEDNNSSYRDVTDWFSITVKEEEDKGTLVSADVKKDMLKDSRFYGKTYYLHIPVRIRSEEELKVMELSLSDWYQRDHSLEDKITGSSKYRGTFAIANTGQLYVVTNTKLSQTLAANYVAVRIPMSIVIRKYADDDNIPVEGIVFGLFGGEENQEAEAIMTARTDENGFAHFIPAEDTFYQEKYGDGPYYIKEIEIPEEYKDIWQPSIQKDWSYRIEDLSDISLLRTREEVEEQIREKEGSALDQILWNTPKINEKNSIKVYKKSSDTGQYLKGAEYTLYEWSEEKKDYAKRMVLTEGIDEKKRPYYYNAEVFSNTVDNRGRYKIEETRAPKGCILSKDSWTFVLNEDVGEVTHTFFNPLQKAKLKIVKEGEDGEALEDVAFRIKAAKDIYAPWYEENSGTEEESLLVSKGTVVDTIKTDQEGIALSTKGHELYIGEYLVEEIQGAKGYVCEFEPRNIILHYSEDGEETIEYTVTIPNEKIKPAMSVAKIADRTRNEMGMGVFFDKEKGRYAEKKVAGTYLSEESIDYSIVITNTGNVKLVDLELTDTMDHIEEENGYCLEDFIEEDTAYFMIPKEGYYQSEKGEKVPVSYGESERVLLLEELSPGDSVVVHYTAKIQKNAANAFSLRNEVSLSAKYEDQQGEGIQGERKEVDGSILVDEQGNSLTRDWDDINIPGLPEAKVAKAADRTTGITWKEGRYEGNKMEGYYEYGDIVDFAITVTNDGTADLYQILVEDSMEERLWNSLEEDTVLFADGNYTTTSGEEIHALHKESEKKGTYTLLLDYLAAGDSVELHLTGKVKSGVKADTSLRNDVVISAEYQERKDVFVKVPHRDEMEDSDTIGIGVPDICLAKLADKTTGVEISQGRYEGKKESGTYTKGETVTFLLTVTNLGHGTANNVEIIEQPKQNMQKYITMKGFSVKEGEKITTRQGNLVEVTSAGSDKITIDCLMPEDSVEILYYGEVKEDIKTIKNLANEAEIRGFNRDGSPIPETEKMKDKDKLHLKKEKVDKEITPTQWSGYPKTGDNSNPGIYFICIMASVTGIGILWRKRRKHGK